MSGARDRSKLDPSPVCTRLLLTPKTPGIQMRKDSKYCWVLLSREKERMRGGGGGEREKGRLEEERRRKRRQAEGD